MCPGVLAGFADGVSSTKWQSNGLSVHCRRDHIYRDSIYSRCPQSRDALDRPKKREVFFFFGEPTCSYVKVTTDGQSVRHGVEPRLGLVTRF
jgi:hypothetical protein